MAIFQTKFAENGDRNTIPQTSNDGSVNWSEGWTSDYSKNPLSGGKYIERQDMNGIIYELTNAIETIASGGSGSGSGVIEYTSNLTTNPLQTCQGGFDIGGIQIRFGNEMDLQNGLKQINFNNAFNNACIGITLTSIYSQDACIMTCDNVTKNGFKAHAYWYNNIPANTSFRWIAIGF